MRKTAGYRAVYAARYFLQTQPVNTSIATSIRASQLTVEQIETELADVKARAAEKWRVRQRVGLVRRLLSLAEPRSEPEQAMDYPTRP
jgi:hypothetical protein